MILHDAYATLKRLGLVATHTAFSSIYLSKAPRYYGDLICSKRPPSVAALLSLFMRFQAIADAYRGNPSVAIHAIELDRIKHQDLDGIGTAVLLAVASPQTVPCCQPGCEVFIKRGTLRSAVRSPSVCRRSIKRPMPPGQIQWWCWDKY